MKEDITFVGLDAHKNSIHVSHLAPQAQSAVAWELANEPRAVRRMVRKIQRQAGGPVRFCYEAGPCGYALQRQIQEAGAECVVVAPSLIPVKPGDRIKTDKRDARKLAELFGAGLLTEVHPPTPEEESVRDLVRCREDAKEDQLRARHRLGKFLLRRALIWKGTKKNWSRKHREWLRTLGFEHPAERAVFDDYLLALEQVEDRLRSLDGKLQEISETETYRERVGWLRCFRGIDTVTAMTLLAELHDFRRFQSARELMAYLGLVPSESSSSDRTRRGRITKAGNTHVRRVLVEAAWHYRHPARIGVTLSKRREGQPARVIAIADRAAQRLYRRHSRMSARGKPPGKTVVAVARELVGFVWAALYTEGNQDGGRRQARSGERAQ